MLRFGETKEKQNSKRKVLGYKKTYKIWDVKLII